MPNKTVRIAKLKLLRIKEQISLIQMERILQGPLKKKYQKLQRMRPMKKLFRFMIIIVKRMSRSIERILKILMMKAEI